jgi:GH24 family phage-related lysozyme (muramidase)
MPIIVQPGDSLSAIAEHAGVPLAALLGANPSLSGNPDVIHPGELIRLPGEVTGPSLVPAPVVPEPVPDGISDRAARMIVMFEVSSPAVYATRFQAPTWPAGQSGVTIGVGYDLGTVTAARLEADWGDQLDASSLGRLAACCGIRGQQASQAIGAVRDISVPWAAAEAVFRTRTLPATAAQTRAALANTAALAADSFGALVSLVYNRGPSFAAAGARYLEMRAIAAAMASRDFGAVPAQFRAMKRLWQSDPALAGLVARREQEAILFEAGLAEAAG